MSSETITRNDLTNILNDVLPSKNEFTIYPVTSATTSNGSVQILHMTIYYNNDFAIVNGRIGLQNVTVNTRPTITITVPEDMPTCDIESGLTLRGAGASPVATDSAHMTHTKGTTTASINFYNYIGTAAAGYIEVTF